jgi:hypothetical protein
MRQLKPSLLLSIFVLSVAAFGALGTRTLSAKASPAACDRYAQSYSRQFSANGQTVRGAGRGALVGAGVGAISGRAGRGAAIGAGVGAVAGGARRAASASNLYHDAYRDCMAGRTY